MNRWRRDYSSVLLELIEYEKHRQEITVELIASENFVSEKVLAALGSCLTNKYAEGYPHCSHYPGGNKGRYYGGCHVVDEVEDFTRYLWRKIFKTDYHVNVQPHSGSSANMAAYETLLQHGDTIMGMELSNGGHLSHGSPASFSGKWYNFVPYGVDDKGFIDYDMVDRIASECKPKAIVVGASSYSRTIDYKVFRSICDKHNCYMIVDMAHIAGLIATGYHNSPFDIADIITTTTHKTLRGPRGGMVFCKPEYAKRLDSVIFPMLQGGPIMNIIAAKGVAAGEAMTPAYKKYIHNVRNNAEAMAKEFMSMGFNVVSGGTDNHMFIVDLSNTNVSGRTVQTVLDKEDITLNCNAIPNDKRSVFQTSGIRIGTPAMTTKGWNIDDFCKCANRIVDIIRQIPGYEGP